MSIAPRLVGFCFDARFAGACVGAVLGGVALGLMIVFLMRSQRVRYEKRFRSATVSQMQSDNKAM